MQVSVGTLLGFTVVAISILILRYLPPDEMPLPPSLQESIDFQHSSIVDASRGVSSQVTEGKGEAPFDPLIVKEGDPGKIG
ncbi:hypothetical protein ACHQM5_008332 [Ranunculus cassubicifolius]